MFTFTATIEELDSHTDYFIEATAEGFVAECNNLFCNFRSDSFADYSDAESAGQIHGTVPQE